MAILIEYAIAPAAISVFIGGYIEALGLFGLTSGWPIYLACYAVFVGIHLYGVGEAMRLMFAITVATLGVVGPYGGRAADQRAVAVEAVALVALVVFVIAMAPKFEFANLFDIEPTGAAGANSFIPFGYAGVLGELVYGIWFFLCGRGSPVGSRRG
jgi:ethanolamine permease